MCLVKDGTASTEGEKINLLGRWIPQVRHRLPANRELMTWFLSCTRQNYCRDLPARRWRAGAGFILAHSYLKVLPCDYVNFSCFLHSSITL